jgi:hypothetical protein
MPWYTAKPAKWLFNAKHETRRKRDRAEREKCACIYLEKRALRVSAGTPNQTKTCRVCGTCYTGRYCLNACNRL